MAEDFLVLLWPAIPSLADLGSWQNFRGEEGSFLGRVLGGSSSVTGWEHIRHQIPLARAVFKAWQDPGARSAFPRLLAQALQVVGSLVARSPGQVLGGEERQPQVQVEGHALSLFPAPEIGAAIRD